MRNSFTVVALKYGTALYLCQHTFKGLKFIWFSKRFLSHKIVHKYLVYVYSSDFF